MRTVFVSLTVVATLLAGTVPTHAADNHALLTIERGPLIASASADFTFDVQDPDRTIRLKQDGVTVKDLRAGVIGWTATASVSAPADVSGNTLDAEISYVAGSADVTGTSTVTAVGASQSGSGVVGNNRAVWDAEIAIDVPSGSPNGSYTVTVTHSVF